MSLVLDLIVVLIVAFFAFLSAKKGFVYTLVEVTGLVAAIIIAFTFSTPIANGIYDGALQPAVNKTIQSVVDEGAQNVETAVDGVVNKLPSFLTQSKLLNFSQDGLVSSLNGQETTDTIQIVSTVSNNYIKPALVKLISAVIRVILVVVLFFVVQFVAKFVNKLFTISFVGKINKTLGAILGAVKGLVIATVFCLIISLILSVSKEGFLIFTNETINSSVIFKFLMGFSPF